MPHGSEKELCPAPLLPPWLFRNANFSLITGVGALLGAILFTVMTFLPIYLQDAQGNTASQASMLLPNSLASMVVNMAVGRIITKTGSYKVFVIGNAASCTVGVFLLGLMTPGSGSRLRAYRMAASEIPTRCETRMNATRRRTSRLYRR
ncbi:hypothetical protein AB0I53_06585 [Saccharopolyspora sp. NPDC050389]|uniref:hypothetical protein n=1 Tax=Saccharopolyspora sp. NPDC050389 TaxID=3155516 RepID=UPI0033CBCBD9